MDEAQRRELHELRRRAYGPDPDLGAADLDRLRELEAPAAPDDAARPARSVPDGRDPDLDGDMDAHLDGDGDAHRDAVRDADPAATRPAGRRRTAVLWAASVLVAVGATAAVTSGIGGAAAAREVGVVALDPDRPVPERWDDWYEDVATGVGGFHGLTVIGLVNPEDDAPCVTVVAAGFSLAGNPVGGCAAGGFPARGLLTVTDDMPAELRDEFPDGTALEFVLDGRSVRVTAG